MQQYSKNLLDFWCIQFSGYGEAEASVATSGVPVEKRSFLHMIGQLNLG